MTENLKVSFKITGLGWVLFSLEADGKRIQEEISDVRDGIPEIAEALINLCESRETQTVEFELELPYDLVMRIDWVGDLVEVKLGERNILTEDWREYGEDIHVEFVCTPTTLVAAFYEAIMELIEEQGLDKINEEWDMSVLTTEHLAALRRVAESQGC